MEAIVFIRVSDKKKEPETGIDDLQGQRNEVAKVVARLNATVISTLEIEGVSGDEVYDDPRFHSQVLKFLTPGRVLIVRDMDRLIRASGFAYEALRAVLRTGCQIHTKDGLADLSSATGRFSAGVLAGVGGLEKERIRERTVSQKRALREAGIWVDGRPPLGTVWNRKTRTWSLDEHAPKVVDAFRRFAAGESMLSICPSLPAGPVPGRATCMTQSTMARLLANTMYRDGHPAGLAPLIDDATWKTVQQRKSQIHAGRRVSISRTSVAAPYSSFLRCGLQADATGWVDMDAADMPTRHVMYGGHHTGKARHGHWYVCRCVTQPKLMGHVRCGLRPVKAPLLNATVDALLAKLTASPWVAALAVDALSAPDSSQARKGALQATLVNLMAKKRRQFKAYSDGLVDETDFETEQRKTITEIAKVEAELATMAEPTKVTADDVGNLLASPSWLFPAAGTPTDKRAWCQQHLDGITVQPNQTDRGLNVVSIGLRIPLAVGGCAHFALSADGFGDSAYLPIPLAH